MRSPAGLCSPARRARKRAAATAVDALDWGSSLLEALGEVAGEGRVLETPAGEPSVEAA
ncbi:MAG: hypothetical protein OXU35_11210 [Acidobacteriota bacterium]|nr:hypothetical protein [Acidobacteriota bacterium]